MEYPLSKCKANKQKENDVANAIANIGSKHFSQFPQTDYFIAFIAREA